MSPNQDRAVQAAFDGCVPANEVDEMHRELKRAQGIIDGLKRYREVNLCCPFDSTPEMRARIRELAYPPRDDFDRAVLALLRDFERSQVCVNAKPITP